ncbi:MAG: hypothetical protein LUI12_12895 [Clostridiales bacterium]|nr:hypothetical protein [Clostridiales bacterium]
MAQQTHLWIEDREGKSGFVFWKKFMQELFPDILIESKKNSSELVKAVKNISDTDKYIVALDNAFDNPEIYRERRRFNKYAVGKNVIKLDLICFEYLLLEFNQLLDWIYAEEDEFRQKREKAIIARNALINIISSGSLNYKWAEEIAQYDDSLEKRNVEQLSAKLLYDLTRNTGFEVSKGRIGDCWVKSCCEWGNRQENDICGLDISRLSLMDKMKSIYYGTSLKAELLKAGLEVAV